MNTSGIVQWTINGVEICAVTGNQVEPRPVSDGARGAIITWYDYRNGTPDIYAQRVDHEGNAPPVGVLYNDQRADMPHTFSLSQNYPNPFNPVTEINYTLPRPCQVKLEIYNLLGQRVATLVDGYQPVGYRTVSWNGSCFASGVYFYRLEAREFTQTRTMVLVK